jgi:hypothetical protein
MIEQSLNDERRRICSQILRPLAESSLRPTADEGFIYFNSIAFFKLVKVAPPFVAFASMR